MAEDLENTQKKTNVLLKKQKKSESAEAAPVPAKSAEPAAAKPAGTAADGEQKKKVVVIKRSKSTAKKMPVKADVSADAKTSESAAPKEESPRPAENAPFELSPPRPNSKQGNLADRPRTNGPHSGQRPNNYQGGQNYRPNNGFSGSQARDGARQGNGGRPGYGPQQDGRPGYGGSPGGRPGYGQQQDRPGYNNRPGYGPQQGGRPGYGQQQDRPGYNNRPGYGPQGGRPGYNNRPGPGGAPGGRPGFNRPNGGRPGFGGPGRPSGGYGGGSPSPLPVETGKTAKKSFNKSRKTVYTKRDRENDLAEKLLMQKKKQSIMANPVPKEIEIMETISISELAKKMNLKASDLIGKLMGMGMLVSINQSIDADTATLLASEYDCEVHIISLYDETVIEREADIEEELLPRCPVVTIMGHVDHGKTKTLDAIRSSHVAESEFGGITQHIGAYQVDTPKGKITFLDTPGHEAFTMMRARGAQITDIVVLVVAADDGVMPQTTEAINHAKDAGVPIIVAVNKCDKPEANPDRVKTQLSELGLTPEDWGGETIYVHISALKKEGIDDLLDAILLQAEVLELKANWKCRAEGKILESKVDHGRGIVSTVVIERGVLRLGDSFVAGVYSGRVRAIFNDRGEKLEEAVPSTPVEILGFEGMPNAGDPFQVTENERSARLFSSKRQELKRFEDAKNVKKITLDNLYDTIQDGEMMEFKVVIKADVQGSAEALKQSLEKLSTRDIRLSVIHASAGAINESDVMLAAADSNAIIIGFNVRPTPQAKMLADQEKVDIRKYNVIYKCVEEITLAMEGMLKPDVKEEVIGTVDVRDVFRVPKVGVIAGSYVTSGIVKRSASAHVIRDGIVLFTGKIVSLKRFKDDVKEVASGYECGIGIENWQDIIVGDQFEIFEMVEVARKLSDSAKPLPASEA